MPAVDLTRRWTREEVLALPDDGNRYELVDGKLLVSPGPRPLHQIASWRLEKIIDAYVREHGIGTMFHAPADLDLRSGQVVQPDIFVSPPRSGRAVREWKEVGIPPLVVEILSGSTTDHDRVEKRALYQRVGVPLYWIVDVDARRVEVWTPDRRNPEIALDTISWCPNPGVPALEIDLAAFFAAVLAE